ncbi:major facilitator superfamily domain-containing protein [Trametes maxima]|nr:major facilitator superfamily domain-containing protein [Trametes maxima]
MSTSRPAAALERIEEKTADPDSRGSVNKSDASTTVQESSDPVSVAGEIMPPAGEPVPDLDVPEGGRAAWCTVAGAFLVQVCGFGYTGSFGVYQDYYTRVYLVNESSSAISWIGSINGFVVISSGLIVGRLFDRGYFYHLLYGGSLLLSFSLFMLSLAKPDKYYQILLSQGIGVALGAGMVYIPSVAVLSQYFHKRRALAMTIVASGSSLGSIIHPIMLNNTLNKLGFGSAARANAGMISGLLVIACVLMRTRKQQLKTPPNLWVSAKRFSKDGAYVFATIGMTTFALGLYFPLFYIQLDSVKHGLSDTFSFYSLVILNVSSFFGRLSPGFVAHVLGVGNMTVASTFVCAILIFGMIGLGSLASVVVIGVIYGFFAGVYITMLAPLLALLTDDMSELGVRIGIAFGFYGKYGTLVAGTPIDGALLTDQFHWWRPAIFSGVMALVGFGCYLTSIILLRRRQNLTSMQVSLREKA